ncbi:unnamed protein product [Ectocarpus sp. 6 AP-2014]
MLSGGKSGSEAQGAMSSSGSQIEQCELNVAIKAGESESSEDEEEHNISPVVQPTQEAIRRGERCPSTPTGKIEESKRKGKKRKSRHSMFSPTRELSKRQRKASESQTGEECGGGEAPQYRRRQRDCLLDKMDRHNAGDARGTTAPHGHCTTMKPDFCSKRAKQNVVHIASKTCGHPACMKRPSFGKAGSKKAEFCSRHQKQGMVDLVSKRCGHPGCIKSPSFGEHGSTKR